jgi:hypothetical protein
MKEGLMPARRLKRRWERHELRELKSCARRKVPARRIAKRLKRTEGATRQKAFALRISLESRKRA